MIQKQWQIAIDDIEQFRGFAEGNNYSDIRWEGDPISEDDLITKYNEIKRSFWNIELIEKRNNLLVETDWMFRSDLNPSQELIDYCQALRDITDNFDPFVEDVVWPEKPK
jgi:hypothetical protein